MRSRIACFLTLLLAMPTGLFADFHYTETTKITGGSMIKLMKFAGTFSKDARKVGDPVVSSVYVKGNRMARVNPEDSEIVDLDAETVTHIDHQKKQYYVITFEQMRERAQEAARQLEARQEQASKTPDKPQPNNTEYKFDVKVRQTGAAKQYNGLDTKESILTLTMQATDKQSGQSGNLAMSSDIWLTPEIPGYQELRDFQMRYAKKLGDIYGDTLMPAVSSMRSQMQPGTTQGMSEMAEEASKLKGVPLYTVTRMGSTADGKPLPAASEAPLPDNGQNAEMPSKGDMAKQGAADAANDTATNAANHAIASKLGGFGGFSGFGHKKKAQPEATTDTASTTSPNASSAVLMETTTEYTELSSSPIDNARFLPPAGYTRVPVPELTMNSGKAAKQ